MEPDPITITANPTNPTILPGGTRTVRLTFHGGTTGTYPVRADVPGLVVTPSTFDVVLSGSADPSQDVVVSAPVGTEAGNYTLSVGTQLEVYGTVPITVTDGTADFAFTATPMQVSVPNGVVSSDVQFTVASLNGFSGPVTIHWDAEGAVEPRPTTNDFTGNVTPSTPFTFSRKMFRMATHPADTVLVFTATDDTLTKEHSVSILVEHQGE